MQKVLQTIVRDTERYSISNSSELPISKPDLYIEKIVLQGGETATTDDIIVTRSGKNLLDGNLRATPKTQGGVTIQYLPDEDCYLINGTCTGSTTKYIIFEDIFVDDIIKISTIHLSGSVTIPSGYALFYTSYRDNLSNTKGNWANANLENGVSKNNIKHTYIEAHWFYVSVGVSFDNYKVKIQIEKGDTATAYEPYLPPKSLTFSRDYLLSLKGASNLVYMIMPTITKNGITFTNNGDRTITVDGTATAKSVFYFCGGKSTTGKLILLGCPSGGSYSSYYLEVKCYDTENNLYYLTDIGNGNISKKQISKFTDVYVVIQEGQTVSNLVFKPELFDLTSIYGEGNEPTTVEQFLKDYPLSSTDNLTITKNSVKYNDTDITSEITGLDEFFSIDADVSTITTSANIALGEITEDISYSVKSNKRAVYTGEDVIYSSQTFIKE